MKLFRVESYRRGIIISSILSVFGKILGYINNLIIAYYFGTQAKTDVYFYFFATFSLLASFLTTMDSSVLIAQSMRLREKKSFEESMRFLNFFLYFFICIVAILTIIIALNPIDIFLIFSKFKYPILANNYFIIILSLPLFFLIVVTTYLNDILYSFKYFTLPVIASILNTGIIISFIIIFQVKYDILSVILGTILSYIINLFLLVYLLKRELKWKFKFKFINISKEVWHNLIYSQAGNVFTILASYIPLYLLSNYSEGVISGLNYGKRIADLPILFISTQLALVTGIKFNELYSKNDFKTLDTIFRSTVRLLIFILTPISGIFFLNGEEIIKVLFYRGAFDYNSVKISTDFLVYFGITLPFLVIISMIGNLFVAAQIIKYSFIYQIVVNSMQIGIMFFGVNLYGYIGYPVAVLITNVLNVFFVYLLFVKFFPYVQYLEIIKYLVVILLTNVLIIIIIKIIPLSSLSPFVKLLIASLVYIILLIGINLKFDLNTDINNLINNSLIKFKLLNR